MFLINVFGQRKKKRKRKKHLNNSSNRTCERHAQEKRTLKRKDLVSLASSGQAFPLNFPHSFASKWKRFEVEVQCSRLLWRLHSTCNVLGLYVPAQYTPSTFGPSPSPPLPCYLQSSLARCIHAEGSLRCKQKLVCTVVNGDFVMMKMEMHCSTFQRKSLNKNDSRPSVDREWGLAC